MARLSTLKLWLSKLPKPKRLQIEEQIRSARSISEAYRYLKKAGFKGSYDAVQTWKRHEKEKSDFDQRTTRVAETVSQMGGDNVDPIGRALHLASALSQLCEKIVTLLTAHDWLLEDGQERLSNRDAMKLLAALPGLTRASSGTILEMSQQKARLQDKELSLGVLQELEVDWVRTLSHDNPELSPLLRSVTGVTKSRLELDRNSLLEKFLEENSKKVSAT